MELELEKVYQPCVLLTKKRYAGYMYESAGQSAPTWDAKGIETVRRDGCPAERKILERAMRLLFDTQACVCTAIILAGYHPCMRLLFDARDLPLVKRYVLYYTSSRVLTQLYLLCRTCRS